MIATATNIKLAPATTSRIAEVDWKNLTFGKVFSDHMLVIEYADGQWKNATIKPYGKMEFSPAISALHYGQALFEGLKAFKNKEGEVFIFRPERNAERLNKTAARLCMPTIPVELFMDGLAQLVKMDSAWIPTGEGESLYIRPHMFATDEYIGVKPSDSYLFVIFTGPVGKYYTNELNVKIENSYTRAARGGVGHAKAAGNYAASLYPTQLAKDEGFDQLLWTDGQEHAYFEESGTMNVMFLHGKKLMTPALSDSILEGVTRSTVLTLAKDWGYQVEERKVSVKEITDLLKANELDAAFGVGTAATIAPIKSIHYDGTSYALKTGANNEFALRVGTYLDRLKRGHEEDVHNWNFRI
ncbi:MAG: branched-chain amino acid aminotransferase [Flavobacteriales bacterium]